MRAPLPDSRIVRGATSATITYQSIDADGEPTTPTGTVTVAVTYSDGTSVSGVGAVSTDAAGLSSVTLPLAALDVVEQLTVVWSDDGTEVHTEVVDVVGPPITIADLVADEPGLNGETTVSVLSARRAAEDRFTDSQNRSLFHRFTVDRVDGSGTSYLENGVLSWPDLVEVRWVRIYTSATVYTELTASQLAAIRVPDPYSRLLRLDGNVWPCGSRNIEIGYVFGMSAVPHDLRRAVSKATRYEFTQPTSGVPERATSWASADGLTFGLSTPGQRGAVYGIPEIDAVWSKYRDPRPVIG